jgi:MinD superfamily P-loop ATPase
LKIAIVSTKGGVGKTLIAVNLFYAIKDVIESSCTLVDSHIQVPNIYHYIKGLNNPEEVIVNVRIPEIDQNVCTFCERCINYCAFDSILMIKDAGHIKVLDDYCTSCGACVYACNDGAISERTEALGKVTSYSLGKDRFVEGKMFAIRPLASPIIQEVNEQIKDAEISIIDTPPGSSYPFAESIRDANYVILLAEEGQAGLKNLMANIQLLREVNQEFGVVINKSGITENILFDYLQNESIKVLANIPFKREYAEIHSSAEIIVQRDKGLKDVFVRLFESIQSIVEEGQA